MCSSWYSECISLTWMAENCSVGEYMTDSSKVTSLVRRTAWSAGTQIRKILVLS